MDNNTLDYVLRKIKELNNVIYTKSISIADINVVGKSAKQYFSDEEQVYCGITQTTDYDFVVNTFSIAIYGISKEDIGTEYEFTIGKIDQRNWLLPRVVVNVPISSISNSMAEFDFSEFHQIVKAGEVIFIKATRSKMAIAQGSNNILPIINSSKYKLGFTTNLLKSLTTGIATNIKLDAIMEISPYASDAEVNIALANSQKAISIASQKQDAALVDVVTGIKYTLVMRNGQPYYKSNKYKNILCIGNSYTVYGVSKEWGANRCMASSDITCQWFYYLHDIIGSNVFNTGLVSIERGIPMTDFSTFNLKTANNIEQKSVDISTIDFDCIVVQGGENIRSTNQDDIYSTFSAFFKFLKGKYPIADIVYLKCHSDSRYTSIQNAALDNGVIVSDASSVSLLNKWQANDFVPAEGDGYFEITNPGVYGGHPSDIGEYNIANTLLKSLGYNAISNRKFNLTKKQATGGQISSSADFWISGGSVCIRCVANEGYEITGMSVVTASGATITPIKNIGTYTVYNFTMPKEDVTVTPIWNKK